MPHNAKRGRLTFKIFYFGSSSTCYCNFAKEYEERILTFIDIPVEVLHETQYGDGAKGYNEEKDVYEIYHSLDAAPTIWAVADGANGVNEISENVYEIVVMYSFDESAPKELGILTVENNDGIPKYLSFIKTEA